MERKCHILLVDDDMFQRNLLSEELTAHGYVVFSAEQGFQALDLLDPKQVDVVLTDIFMPDMEGLELIQRLRRCCPEIPIFAMSGGVGHAGSEDFLGFAKGLGADEVFAKPVDLAVLISKLEQYFQRGDGKPA